MSHPRPFRCLPCLTACALVALAVACHTGPEVRGPQTLRILTYNIHHGEGVDGRLDLERIANLINEHQPDLVALQEVDRGVARTQGRDLPAELSRLTGLHVAFSKNIDHQGGEYGNAILSRQPIVTTTNRHFRMLRDGEQRGLLAATVEVHGEALVFMATHLDFRPDPAERLSNVAEIKAAAARHPEQLVIVAGDFNDHPDGAVHRAMKETFTDAWERRGQGSGFTYSSTAPKSRIDYVYVRPANGWEVTRAEVLASQASDHLPLLVELERSGAQ
jgi:endonuclease/exonuclease/phosphatase family metal-dependent hydrolase